MPITAETFEALRVGDMVIGLWGRVRTVTALSEPRYGIATCYLTAPGEIPMSHSFVPGFGIVGEDRILVDDLNHEDAHVRKKCMRKLTLKALHQ